MERAVVESAPDQGADDIDDGDHLFAGLECAFVSVVTDAVDAFGELYLEGTFTMREIAESLDADGNWDMVGLTARLAAKESVVQALHQINIAHREIEIVGDVLSSPHALLCGLSARRAQRIGVGNLSLSVSHDGDCITASCLAVISPAPVRELSSRWLPTTPRGCVAGHLASWSRRRARTFRDGSAVLPAGVRRRS